MDFPIEKWWFSIVMLVYQRVNFIKFGNLGLLLLSIPEMTITVPIKQVTSSLGEYHHHFSSALAIHSGSHHHFGLMVKPQFLMIKVHFFAALATSLAFVAHPPSWVPPTQRHRNWPASTGAGPWIFLFFFAKWISPGKSEICNSSP